MKRVLVCGVANSGNLGDRIIAETINYIIHLTNDQYEVLNFDFTVGKVEDFENTTRIKLNSTSMIKQLIPDFMRSLKVYRKYKKNIKLATELKESIAKVDMVVIGGGHLLIDNYLNFPIGINNIIKEARLSKTPVIFALVGAKGPWSKAAKKVFLEALEYAKYISVRDSDSRDFLISIDHNLKDKVVALSDPALFVNEMNRYETKNHSQKKVGLGIMDPNEMRRHSNFHWSRQDSTTWWTTLAKKLTAFGYNVNIFTNGAPTDNGFVEYFIKRELANVKGISFLDYPTNYKDVLATIQQQDLVVAQRLHACLPSISLMKNTFGIVWDKKLESNFKELGLNDYIIDFNEEVEVVVETILKKIEKNCQLEDEIFDIINVKKREMLDFVEKGLREKD
ncbi:polysaccharide pyruvyl transferase family protein [Ammoniphilus sp. 3BR4]|uniref:polysaccharide pyruvyl transferase family protein n=1 Tax=Ammoniphilus sp. 3BR4 TaxID=3158265 RepID=UPI003466F6FC